jgi:hypothetical protein
MGKIATTFKHKIGLANTIPNSAVFNKHEYGLFHIWDRQLQLHATNWLSRIITTNTTGLTAKHRLQTLQNHFWIPKNILEHMQEPFLKPGQNLTHDIIWLLKQHGFTFHLNNTSQILTIPEMLGTPIVDITEATFYKKHRSNLRKYHIMFVEQLLNASKSKILTWP